MQTIIQQNPALRLALQQFTRTLPTTDRNVTNETKLEKDSQKEKKKKRKEGRKNEVNKQKLQTNQIKGFTTQLIHACMHYSKQCQDL